MHTQKMLGLLNPPKEDIEKGPIITWHYISTDPTTTHADCPLLDYLLIPGPDPVASLPDGCADFLKARFDGLKGLLLICTGAWQSRIRASWMVEFAKVMFDQVPVAYTKEDLEYKENPAQPNPFAYILGGLDCN
ncbi:unnamed protein product [Cyclocybe aegerita]|uniref:Uncharacterized protein n=1 Tax=Cyclocybe aegerita TaxID=1973307 RepID=A0A8S0XL31_CYCAE|nr:unnamed protein product [Cyclocybe aegerita]